MAKLEFKNAYVDKDNLRGRVAKAMEGVEVAPMEPLGSVPKQLQNLRAYKNEADRGVLDLVEYAGSNLLKAIPARVIASSPLDRMGLLYTLTVVFLDKENDPHSIEVDVPKTDIPLGKFQDIMAAVSQELAALFADTYRAKLSAKKGDPEKTEATPET